MKVLTNNKGVIVFYLLLIVTTLVVINFNKRHLESNNEYVYLTR